MEGPNANARPTIEDLQALRRTLRRAGEAIRAELEYVTGVAYLDAASLDRGQRSAAELAGQAAFLANLLRSLGVSRALVAEAASLNQLFRDAEDQIGSLLQAARQGARE